MPSPTPWRRKLSARWLENAKVLAWHSFFFPNRCWVNYTLPSLLFHTFLKYLMLATRKQNPPFLFHYIGDYRHQQYCFYFSFANFNPIYLCNGAKGPSHWFLNNMNILTYCTTFYRFWTNCIVQMLYQYQETHPNRSLLGLLCYYVPYLSLSTRVYFLYSEHWHGDMEGYRLYEYFFSDYSLSILIVAEVLPLPSIADRSLSGFNISNVQTDSVKNGPPSHSTIPRYS